MTEPEQQKPYDPLTPVQVENRIVDLDKSRTETRMELTAAADELVEAQEELTMAKARLEFAIADLTDSPECLVVGRGPGEVTVAQRDAFVVKRTRQERDAVMGAQAVVRRRRAVVDAARRHISEIADQTISAQALLKSANEAYRGIGGPR